MLPSITNYLILKVIKFEAKVVQSTQ